MTKINISLLSDLAQMPSRGSAEAAGYDLYAATENIIDIQPHSTVKVSTDIAVELPAGYFGAVYPRSGIAAKRGLRPANCTGVIDSDQRGAVIVALHNDTDEIQSIEPKERIAQLIVQPYLPVEFNQVDTLTSTDRGSNGFGSSGTT